MNNKSRASGFCPLIDSGPPKGEVWVQVKKAVLPYHIVEMGSGEEGRRALAVAKHTQEAKNWIAEQTRTQNAVIAYRKGAGNLTDVLKKSDVVTDPHYSAQDARRDAELFPVTPEPTKLQSLWKSFKQACKDVWDGAQPRD